MDSRVLDEAIPKAKKMTEDNVKPVTDVRELVQKSHIDAISIVTPDHWHITMALMGISNGKHIYVEKPCSHNPEEGEILMQAQQKYRNSRSTIHGTKGTILLDRNVYQVYNMDNKKTKEITEAQKSSTMNTMGGGGLTDYHMTNFVNTIRGKEKPHSPINEGAKSNLLCHLGNYAQATGDTLQTNPQNGKIQNNPKAMKYWSREYEPGWEPNV